MVWSLLSDLIGEAPQWRDDDEEDEPAA